MVNWDPSRRRLLKTSAALAAAASLAGCNDSESDSPSPVLSLSADTGVTTDSEGQVETWADQSGNGYDYAAGSQASRPSVTEDAVNGQPALTFDGDTDHLTREDTMGIPNDSARTFVVVCRLNETTPRSPFIMQGEPGSDSQFYGVEANTFETAGEQFGLYAIGNSYDADRETDTNYHVHTIRTESFSDQGEVINTTTYQIDGEEISLSQVSSGEGSGTSFNGEETAIGAFPVEGTPQATHDGEIAAVRVYDTALSSSERESVESDLADTYGISLS